MAKAKATRKNAVVTYDTNGRDQSGVITFTVLGAGELTFDTNKASESCRERAEYHGWVQRMCDAVAISRDPETNASATPAMKFERMKRLIEHYESGTDEWSIQGRGGFGNEGGLLLRTLIALRDWDQDEQGELTTIQAQTKDKFAGKSDEQLKAFAGKMTAGQRTKLLNFEGLRDIANLIRAEGAKGIDADELLAGLDSEAESEEDSEA